MIPEFDQYPIFYFTNHHSIQGPGDIRCMPDHLQKLDFELEVAIVISKPGRNIPAEQADEHIAGLMIMNDMSARRLQLEEMLLNLGPAKGKDFSTVIGPWLVTLDELQEYEVPCKEGHVGKNWNLRMQCRVNDIQVSDGNLADMDWTFAEIIERASYGVDLFPGDVIGSGTVGTGCFLELNGTGRLNDPGYAEQWLQEGDKVELEVDGLGILTNTIVREDSDFSLLDRKKIFPNDPRSGNADTRVKAELSAICRCAQAGLFCQYHRRCGDGEPESVQFFQYVFFHATHTHLFTGAEGEGQYYKAFIAQCVGGAGGGDQYRRL